MNKLITKSTFTLLTTCILLLIFNTYLQAQSTCTITCPESLFIPCDNSGAIIAPSIPKPIATCPDCSSTPTATPNCETEDFEGFARGTIISNQIPGVSIYGVSNNWGAGNAAMIFDTSNPTGGDNDLRC